jgi:hypothetical protein
MTTINSATVLHTGPTGGLGRAATLAMASRPAPDRPDLLLVGRAELVRWVPIAEARSMIARSEILDAATSSRDARRRRAGSWVWAYSLNSRNSGTSS